MVHAINTKAVELAKELQGDCIVKIFVGRSDSQPFIVQQLSLERISNCLRQALHAQTVRHDHVKILRFKDDDVMEWIYLLHWLKNGGLDADDFDDVDAGIMALVKCWCLGEKYDIEVFQDDVMMCLLGKIEHGLVDDATWGDLFPVKAIQHCVANSHPSSAMRKLVAEEAILSTYRSRVYALQDLSVLEGPAFASEVLMAQFRYQQGRLPVLSRFVQWPGEQGMRYTNIFATIDPEW